MTAQPNSDLASVAPAQERCFAWSRTIVGLAMLLAFARVVAFALVTPVFSHLDEDVHFDTVAKYSRGVWPRLDGTRFSDVTLEIAAGYQSGEFLKPRSPDPAMDILPAQILDSRLREKDPLARQLAADPAIVAATERLVADRKEWIRSSQVNYEAFEPPGYGALAGAWLWLARQLGVRGVGEVVAVRSLGAVLTALAVMLAWCAYRRLFPRSPRGAVAAAVVLAAIPQDIQGLVNNDAIATFVGAVALLAATVAGSEAATRTMRVGAGALMAWPMLAKLTSAHATAAAWCIFAWTSRHRFARVVPVAIGTLTPLLAWSTYCRVTLGMWHGGEHKVELSKLHPAGLDGILAHPIFSLDGSTMFLDEITRRLWRGDQFYFGQEVGWPWTDGLYLALTLLAIAAGLSSWRERDAAARAPTRLLALAVILGYCATAAISAIWDYSGSVWPTVEYPFFMQGRLLSAVLPALAMLLVRVGGRYLRGALGAAFVGALVVGMTISEAVLHWPMVESPHSAWRLLGGGG
ncbi:MAG: hypothetical protein AB7I19_07430 [Planctomycetota bacterium]